MKACLKLNHFGSGVMVKVTEKLILAHTGDKTAFGSNHCGKSSLFKIEIPQRCLVSPRIAVHLSRFLVCVGTGE